MQKWKQICSILLCIAMWTTCLPSMAQELETAEQEPREAIRTSSGAELAQSVERGLISYLKLDGTVADEKGEENQPSLAGSASYEDGIQGKALRFDGERGSEDRIELTGRDDLKFQNGDAFSVGFWYKADAPFGDSNIIGSKSWADARNHGWNVYMNNNLIGFSPISRTIEGDARYTDTTLWDGQWVYVAVTRTEDGTNTMYVNGKKVSPEVRSISSNSQQAQDGVVCIGADYTTKYGPGNSLCLDEVKIWNRALSAEEVAYVYGATPEMESLRVEGPEKAAVGETGITIDLTAKATKKQLGEMEPVEPVAWEVTSGNAEITSNGPTAKLSVPAGTVAGTQICVTAKVGGYSADYTLTVEGEVVPDRLTVTGETEIVKTGETMQKTYTAKLTDENGAEAAVDDPSQIQWTLDAAAGIQMSSSTAGQTVTVEISSSALVGKGFTLTATYQTFQGELKAVIVPNRELPQEILSKVETQMEFDGNLEMVKGSQPTLKGSMTYQQGVEGEGAVFTYGNYLDFGNYDLANKSIAFSLKSNRFTGVQDPCIWGNKDWNNANGKGLIFAYAYNTPSSYKTRIGDGTQKQDHTFNYAPEYWSNFVINIDTENENYSIYKDGKLVKEFDTSGFAEGWQNGAYSLKLGNDGTGDYPWNDDADSEYEFVIDKLMITSEVLTPEEILAVSEANKVLLTEEGKPQVTIEAVGGEKIPSGQLFNVNIHASGKRTGLAARTEFDIKYDPEAMVYYEQQYAKTGISLNDDGNGTLHVSYAAAILDSTVAEYSKSRIVQPIFEMRDLPEKKTVNLMVENIKGYDEAGDEVELDGEGIGYALEVLPVNRLDLNQDGVVGAGDVALAETEEQKREIAEVAAIYPYKRALVITMDGAGKAYDPDQQYLCDESTNSYDVVSDLGTLRPKDGYAMQLFNNEFAMSYTAQATDPPISAQNYCTITHGIPWKSLPSKYQFTNDIAGATLWPDYGLEMPQYPSMFWVIKNQQPERKLFAVAEWNPITNGILEQDVGTYFQYRASTAQNPLCFDQLEEYIQDGRFKDTALTYMQSDTMDHYGHASGYFTEGYYEELKQFDGHFKKIVEAMKEQNLYEDTFFVINADHGGHRNANGTGSHGDPSRDVDMDIMIGARGQTVPAGKRLSGGNNKDIAAMVLSALRLEKPDSMSQSEVFDSSLFLAQEEMASKERTVEKVSFNKQGNRATITVSNQQDQAIKALDTVIALEGRSVDAVTPGAGIGVVRQKEEDGKLYLTLAGENLNGTVAEIAFSDGDNSSFAMQEVMLGAEDGSEIYSDLENQENGSVVISGSGEIKGESYLIQNGVALQSSYEAVFRKPSGEELAVQEDAVIWSVEGAEEIRLPENAVGLETTVTVAPTVPSGTVFTLKANYKGIVAQKEVTVMARAALPDSVLQAVETKITFDNGIEAEIGTTPTVSGSMNYGEGIRGKSGVFTKGNYLDFGNVDLKNKSIVFTLKSNRFTGVKDPVILANKDWNSASGAGFVYAYAWNRTSDYKTRIGDGSGYQDVTFPYTGQEWLNVALIFNTEQGKYDVYLDGELVESFDTSGFETGWQNGAYSLKLGNDGTGKYSANSAQESDYEFEIDEFMIVNKVLTPEEVAVVNLAQVQAPERTMVVEGAASITAPASAQEEAVTQTYTASFYNAQGEKVTVADPQNISWTLSGATEQVTIPETSTGTTVDVTVLYGAADQIINLTAVYQGSDGTACQANLQVSVLEANQIPKSIEFVEVPEKLVVEVPQPGGAPVKLKFRAVAKGASGVELQDYVLDADHYCLLENPSSQSASIEMVEEIVDEKTVTYAVVSITDKAYALEKLTLVAYVTEPDSQPNARQEITLTANRQPKQIVIVGAGSVNVKNASAQVQYTASLLDQYGQTMDSNIVWKVEKADMAGVGISTDGRLTVQQGAESGNIVISATAEETGLKATKTVVVYGPGNNTIGGGGGGRPSSGGSGGGAVVVTGPDNGTENGSQAENGTPSGQLWDRFSDLPAGHWAENAIVSLMAKGIISGDGGSHTIRPEENISREETVKIILGVIGASILPAGNETVDSGTSEWAKEYMLTAKKSGIIKGDEAGNLNGQQPVTRVDAMVMVARAWNVGEGNTALLNQFTDGWLVPDYAKGAVARLIELGIVEGYEDGTIGAGSNITRAEMFVLADRIS